MESYGNLGTEIPKVLILFTLTGVSQNQHSFMIHYLIQISILMHLV